MKQVGQLILSCSVYKGLRIPLLPATEATLIFILMDNLNIPFYCTNNSAYILEVLAHVYAHFTVLRLHSFATGTHYVGYVSVILNDVATRKCYHCCSITCFCKCVSMCISVCYCMQCCCCYMLLSVCVNVYVCAWVSPLLYLTLLLAFAATAVV